MLAVGLGLLVLGLAGAWALAAWLGWGQLVGLPAPARRRWRLALALGGPLGLWLWLIRRPPPRTRPARRPVADHCLVIQHANRPDVVRVIELYNPVYTIGRGSYCNVWLRHDPYVSRLHVRLRWHDGVWQAEPLAPVDEHPTCVNGEPITGQQVVVDGDVITIGETHLRLQPTAKG